MTNHVYQWFMLETFMIDSVIVMISGRQMYLNSCDLISCEMISFSHAVR